MTFPVKFKTSTPRHSLDAANSEGQGRGEASIATFDPVDILGCNEIVRVPLPRNPADKLA
jgi:hypothetical protein